MLSYNMFILEKLTNVQEKYLTTILKYINKKSNIKLFEYNEDFIVNKDGLNLTGKLYLIPNNKAVRFNFNDTLLHSIDTWDYFVFNIDMNQKLYIKPTYTMYIKNTVINILDDIVNFIKGDVKITENNEADEKVEYKKSSSEDVQLKSILINKEVLDYNIDVFEAMKMYAMQVAYGMSNSLIVTGAAGLGKSYEIEEAISMLQKSINLDYVIFKGDITTAGLYEVLFLNRDKLIVFDDCDAVWGDQESVNLLKAALDTHKVRKVSRALKTHFNAIGMKDNEIWDEYKKTGKLPNQFEFKGRVIFISNLNGNQIDKAIISRSLHIDINLTKQEIIDRLIKISKSIFKNVSDEIRETTFDFLLYILENYETKFDLNIRTVIHAMNIRLSNDLPIVVGGKSVPAWQLLIKEFLIKKD